MATQKAPRKARKQYADNEAGRIEKSKDFASKRVSRVLSSLRAVRNLGANKRAYVYTPEHIKRIRDAIMVEVEAVVSAFESKAPAAKESFKL
jgi:hypothetical protein